MLQGKPHLLHRHGALEDHPARREQHQTRHQTQDKIPVGSRCLRCELELEALLSFESAACSGLGLLLGVSFHQGYGKPLPLGAWFNGKATMPHLRGGCLMI
jgi:hypothetical protein